MFHEILRYRPCLAEQPNCFPLTRLTSLFLYTCLFWRNNAGKRNQTKNKSLCLNRGFATFLAPGLGAFATRMFFLAVS